MRCCCCSHLQLLADNALDFLTSPTESLLATEIMVHTQSSDMRSALVSHAQDYDQKDAIDAILQGVSATVSAKDGDDKEESRNLICHPIAHRAIKRMAHENQGGTSLASTN